MILTTEQLALGTATLSGGKLTAAQVDDLIAVFRSYLGVLGEKYPLLATLEAVDDSRLKASKLATCLLLWQDNQFDVSGFAATNSNRSGYTDSAVGENYEIFKYAFGLFWDIPAELEIRFNSSSSGVGSMTSHGGRFRRYLQDGVLQ